MVKSERAVMFFELYMFFTKMLKTPKNVF